MSAANDDPCAFGPLDAHLMREGTHPRLHDKLGNHAVAGGGTRFAVWAPDAAAVGVVGDWNDWAPQPLAKVPGGDGVWSATLRGAAPGHAYKYQLVTAAGAELLKADPFARRHEREPQTASVVGAFARGPHAWRDAAWMAARAARSRSDAPISIYEVHLGSWMRGDGGKLLTYRDLAPTLVAHVVRLGFTHVELMPLTEHPFFGSWGYETTGYFAATARYGPPEDLMAMIDDLHAAGIAVLLDWVPGHFPNDPHGLADFDGSPLFEHPDRRLGFQPEWNTHIFDFGRPEVRSFLLSSALFWLEEFHVDGLRVDGVASMLYRDYARKPGEWLPNAHGGNEYLEAVELLQRLNAAIAREQPGAITVAEESTAWPGVTRATAEGGLGFSYKWDMGWMHDTLAYLALDPIHRSHHHRELTGRSLWQFTERYVLPLSHDEVVHGKRSLLGKLPGDRWQQLATLRLLYAYMFSQPGKKLLFMGSELAPEREWDHDGSLDWGLVDPARGRPEHAQIQLLVGELNRLYREERALHELDCDPAGFRWLEADDAERSVLVYERLGRDGAPMICALNFTPVVRFNYKLGVGEAGTWRELLNTDAHAFGGSGQGNFGALEATPVRAHGRELSLNATLPPLGAVWFRR